MIRRLEVDARISCTPSHVELYSPMQEQYESGRPGRFASYRTRREAAALRRTRRCGDANVLDLSSVERRA